MSSEGTTGSLWPNDPFLDDLCTTTTPIRERSTRLQVHLPGGCHQTHLEQDLLVFEVEDVFPRHSTPLLRVGENPPHTEGSGPVSSTNNYTSSSPPTHGRPPQTPINNSVTIGVCRERDCNHLSAGCHFSYMRIIPIYCTRSVSTLSN